MTSKLEAVAHPAMPSDTSGLLRLFGRNTFWIWVDRGVLSVGTLFAGLFLIRYLAPADFGLYSVALSAGMLAAVAMDLGYSRYAARAVAACPAEGRSILTASLFFSALFGLAELAAMLAALQLRATYFAAVCAGLLLGNFARLHDLTAAFLRAELRPRAMVWASTLGRLSHIVVIFLVVWFRGSVLDLFVGYIFVAVPGLVLRLYQLRHHRPAWSELRWGAMWSLTLRAWPFFSFSLTELGFSQVFLISFSLVASQHEVGLLAAGLAIVSLLHQGASAVADAVLPLMTRLFEGGRMAEVLALRDRILEGLLVLTLPAVAVLFVFAPQICALLGAKYVACAPILRLLALRAPLWILEGFLGAGFLNATNRVGERRNAFAMALLVLVILTLVLGSAWCGEGAAVAFWVATLCVLHSYTRFCLAHGDRLNLVGMFAATAPAAAVMAALCFTLSDAMHWALTLPPAILAYFILLLITARARVRSVGRTLWQCLVGQEST